MGFLSLLRKIREREREMRILILGLDNSGKTTILKKFNDEDIDTISPTVGFNIKTLVHGSHQLNVWDVGGQKSLRAFWRNYFEENEGLIWVVDSCDLRRMRDCRDELWTVLREEKLAGASLLIFANKQDCEGAASAAEIAEALGVNGGAVSAQRHWAIFPCSAVTGEGLLEGIDWLVTDVANRVFMYS